MYCQRCEKRSKTHKRVFFLIRRNRTKRANFRESPLFQAMYKTTTTTTQKQNKTEKQAINSTYVS